MGAGITAELIERREMLMWSRTALQPDSAGGEVLVVADLESGSNRPGLSFNVAHQSTLTYGPDCDSRLALACCFA
jgi:hypothetical protein